MEEKQGFWSRLGDRERRLLVVWGLTMSVMALFLGGYFSHSAISKKGEAAQKYVEAVDDISRKQAEYLSRKSGGGGLPLAERIEKNDLKLQTFLEREAANFNLKIENFSGSKLPVGGKRKRKDDDKGPRIIEETIAIDIRDTEYSNLVAFLDALQRSPELIVIKRIDVSRRKRNPDGKVRISMTVSTFKMEEGS